jgi:hypothetical protein
MRRQNHGNEKGSGKEGIEQEDGDKEVCNDESSSEKGGEESDEEDSIEKELGAKVQSFG